MKMMRYSIVIGENQSQAELGGIDLFSEFMTRVMSLKLVSSGRETKYEWMIPPFLIFFRGNFQFSLIVLVMIQILADCGPASGLSRLSGLVALASRRPPVTRHISSKLPRAMFFYDYH